ncbi:CHAT domain-containing protein [Aquimarina sp. 2201CG5-10]|uniref:CHAT domain-containing protein n=1 Tax=Aquimarina callyspongiae TaxID=3098150 RepID=UPI002AB3761E|nr:CHAT domain-containing protein [Aquimarina sp. 2201CG5-10]MDY8136794.1 CHAT domain-containing protein [Aquimarina sp. 2201CG5-10]
MEYGNFRAHLLTLVLICSSVFICRAQQNTQTTTFLYNQLDSFLQNPSITKLNQLTKKIVSKESALYTKSDQLAWVITNANIGYYFNQYGNIPTAIVHYEKSWKTFYDKQLSDYDIIENCLQPLGNLYIKTGDLPKAAATIKNYLFLAEQSQNIPKIIAAFTNLSIAYNNQGNYLKAIEVLSEGLAIDSNNTNLLTNIATNHLDLGQLDMAESIANKVIALDPNQINAYQVLAAISLNKKDYKIAETYLLQAKTRLLKDKNSTTRILAKWQLAYTDILLANMEFGKANKHLKEIYTTLLPGYLKQNELPIKEDLIADKILLKALDIQAHIYEKLEYPEKAIQAYKLAFNVNEKLNTLYPLQDTKIIQHSQNRNRTESYINLLFSLYSSTNNSQYAELAFKAADYSKAPFVNEALLSKKTLLQYKNDSLVTQQNTLNTELAEYETLILKEKLKGDIASIDQIQKWTTIYDTKTITLKKITKSLNEKYPIILNSKKDLSILKLQKKLDSDKTLLIEYFYGNSVIYQFTINPDQIIITKIKDVGQFTETIKNYIHYFDKASTIINDIKKYNQGALEAYKALKIPEQEKKLLIVPDGILNFIPFEALVTNTTTAIRFKDIPFLLKSSQISYEISASKYLRTSSKDKDHKNILGVFPVFEKTHLELPFSLTESKSIQQYFKGQYLEKEEATYNNFQQKANDHNVIHLSTHAVAGDFLRPASIKFRDQDIFVNQLYPLQLQADLVVLSACETGIGKLIKGEGPISISRGFQYAGIENTLFSLWKINDKTTSQFMKGFYQNLQNDPNTSKSLHLAKLDYLNDETISNFQKSPYYWAAFVYYGEIQDTETKISLWYIISIISFLLIIVFLRKFLLNKT